MKVIERWRSRRRKGADGLAWSDDDIPAFLEAFQPIGATAAKLPREQLVGFVAACSSHPDLQAAYVYDSDFAGSGDPLITLGLVLDETSDVERFAAISIELDEPAAQLFGTDYIFQRLDGPSLDRVENGLSPIYERR
jgi:hypothetical protein